MTAKAIRIAAPAERQIREAERWWRRNRTKAAAGLRDELRDAFQLLMATPPAGSLVDDPTLAGVRRLSLNRTHYFLFYRLSEEVIVVLALWHQSREGGPPI